MYKNKSILYANGSSHTHGGGLEPPKLRQPSAMTLYQNDYGIESWEKRIDIAWPQRLSEILGIEVINESECGGGISRAVRMTFDFIEKNWEKRNELLIILELPIGGRSDVYYHPHQQYYIMNYGLHLDNNEFYLEPTTNHWDKSDEQAVKERQAYSDFEFFFNKFHDIHEFEYKKTTNETLGLYGFCKKAGIEIKFLQIESGLEHEPWCEIFDEQDIFGLSISTWCEENKCRIRHEVDFDDGHPGYFGHIKYAEALKEWLHRVL